LKQRPETHLRSKSASKKIGHVKTNSLVARLYSPVTGKKIAAHEYLCPEKKIVESVVQDLQELSKVKYYENDLN
jgi:hypothetical protein